jgi:adenylate cyclase class IV
LSINSVKELECEVSDFGVLKQIFNNMWIKEKAYQETYREIWTVDNEILFMIDERPGLEPFIEIEWKSEDIVKMYSEKLGFDYNDWIFWTVDEIYYKELWLSHDYINSLPIITFENPPR